MRKKILVILIVVFGCVAASEAANWKEFTNNKNYQGLYDVKSITNPSKNIYRVWEKRVWKEEFSKKLGADYSLILNEFDCGEKKVRILTGSNYKKGEVVSTTATDDKADWAFFPPGSFYDILFNKVCKSSWF